VVSNGGRNDRILEAAPYFTRGDWVRLSLDSGRDETFQAMHKPRQKTTLDEICAWVPKIKDANPELQMGFSFIVTWNGALRQDARIVANLDELALAAERAKRYRFDYFSIKPFLLRADDNGAEMIDLQAAEQELSDVVQAIRRQIVEARTLEDATFKIVESTNLKLLEEQSWQAYSRQPQVCHMQYFRQVLTPHGVFNCPGYRSNPIARIAPRHGYRDEAAAAKTEETLRGLLARFDASHECRNVTCLYNSTNWWIQDLIDHPEKLDTLQTRPTETDAFL
jgi:hypothetical protein